MPHVSGQSLPAISGTPAGTDDAVWLRQSFSAVLRRPECRKPSELSAAVQCETPGGWKWKLNDTAAPPPRTPASDGMRVRATARSPGAAAAKSEISANCERRTPAAVACAGDTVSSCDDWMSIGPELLTMN